MLFLLEMTRQQIGYYEMRRIVVRAKDEQAARLLANTEAYFEGKIWNDPEQTSCTLLEHAGEEMVICISVSDDN